MTIEHTDVIIIGAGLSGIGAAVHLKTHCPHLSFAIFESRSQLGGTWDLFRYPGIRSDSDMYTLGYVFKPWKGNEAIAQGADILEYIAQTSQEHGLTPHIRYQTRVTQASWSSESKLWTLQLQGSQDQTATRITCQYMIACTGYFNYDHGYTPSFQGIDQFQGQVVHPQHWDAQLDYTGKRVVVIGSGATAVTLVPAMAAKAAHVTMLQRSPTYIVSRPSQDSLALWLNRYLPSSWAYACIRWKNIAMGMVFYALSKRYPNAVKKAIVDQVRKFLPANGANSDVDKHFTPNYKPWDQRVCLVPQADLFKAIRSGKASVVTDHIDTFTQTGIVLKSGQTLAADIVVTATGLDVLALGGMQLVVDGQTIDIGKTVSYKGMMLAGVPNLSYVTGYTNASWTLKADLVSQYTCRILNQFKQQGYQAATPVLPAHNFETVGWVDFSSGYVQRALDRFPRQGKNKPWRLNQNYPMDVWSLKYCALDDGVLKFER